MSSFILTTRECPAGQLQPVLYRAIQDFSQAHAVGDLDSSVLFCCETTASRPTPGSIAALLDGNPDTATHLAVIVTPEWLIWARTGDKTGLLAAGARLKGLQVKTFVSKHSKNMELEVSAFLGDPREFVRGSLELGPEPAAQKFCEEVMQAVGRLNPPAKKRFFGLISG